MVYQDECVRLKATFKDFAAALVDPAAIALTIYNPSDVLVVTKAKGDMVNTSLGVWYYQYELDATAPVGTWTAKWLATIGGLHKPGITTFTVETF